MKTSNGVYIAFSILFLAAPFAAAQGPEQSSDVSSKGLRLTCEGRDFGALQSIRSGILSNFKSDRVNKTSAAIEYALESEDYSTLLEAKSCIDLEIQKYDLESKALTEQIASLNTRIIQGEGELRFLESDERRLTNSYGFSQTRLEMLKEDLAEAQTSSTALPAGYIDDLTEKEQEYAQRLLSIEEDLSENKSRSEQLRSNLETSKDERETATSRISDLNLKLTKGRDLKLRVDDLLDEVLSPYRRANEFKTTITIVFSILVGLVIAGVIFALVRDKKVRRSVFSSDSGLQFVTLFSLVIAIILFGVLGTLEGKELSALLGGLSGYILGRTGLQQERQQRQTETKAQPKKKKPLKTGKSAV